MRLWPRRQGSSLDLLVVGLGNPGREYERNRHNTGAMVVDELARATAARGARSSPASRRDPARRPQGRAAQAGDVHEPVRLRGRRGGVLQGRARPVIVVHDETISISASIRLGGGLGGHNGLRSIQQHLKTQDFLRLRVGVGRPERGTRGRSPTGSSDFGAHDDAERSSPAPPMPSRLSTPRVWSARRRRSTAAELDARRALRRTRPASFCARDAAGRGRRGLAYQPFAAQALTAHVLAAFGAAWPRTSWSGAVERTSCLGAVERTSWSAPELKPVHPERVRMHVDAVAVHVDLGRVAVHVGGGAGRDEHRQRQDEDGGESECGLLHRRAPFEHR